MKHASNIPEMSLLSYKQKIECLETVINDLLEACKDAYTLIALERPASCGYVLTKLSDAIAKAEEK